MKWVGMVCMLVVLTGQATAGELVLVNGSRLEGTLANEVLMVSTGSDLIEVLPETVGLLTQNEIRLKDGRILRGTLVGGRVKALTPLGELAIRVEELRMFRADGFVASAPPPPAASAPAQPAPPAPAAARAPATPEPARPQPTVTREPPAPPARVQQVSAPAVSAPPKPATTAHPASSASAVASSASGLTRLPGFGSRLEVVIGESALYRDAVEAASPIGRVVRGERVTYLDSIDRRLRIFNTLIFDGGHWIKVRAADGTEGWLPASTLREVR
ncbi:MAG: SH3 domain-containing protein [Candidatus Rokubacteria bacterium]|nr:SH3 domain-containing protein [Candidatus Rokubacteria bacterium]